MDGHHNISEQPFSAREKSLREKIVRLENQLQGYKSQIDILDGQRQKLEERTLDMESVLTKTKKELLQAKQEVLDKELAEIQLSEELKSMTLQAEEYKRLFMAESNKNRCGIDRLEALILNVDGKKVNEDAPNRIESFKELISMIQEGFQAQIKMVFDKLSDAEDKLCGSLLNQEEIALQKKIKEKTIASGSVFELVKPSGGGKGQDDGRSHQFEQAIPPTDEIQSEICKSGESTHKKLSYTSTEHEGVDNEVEASTGSAPKPTVQFLQTQPSFSLSQENAGHAHLPTHVTGRRTFTANSPSEEDCAFVYEVRASVADREKAHRLFLPPNFFNYTKHEACPGCIGCCGISEKEANSSKEKNKENKTSNITPGTTEDVLKPVTSTPASHTFGEPLNFGQLTFPSFKATEGNAFSETPKDSQKTFQGARRQLFAESTEEAKGHPSFTVSNKTSTESALSFTFGTLSSAAGNKISSASPLSLTFGAPSSTVTTKTSSASPLSFTFESLSSAAGNKTSSKSPLSFTFEALSPAASNKTSSASPLSFTFGASSSTVSTKTSSALPLSFTFGASSSTVSTKTSSALPLSFTFGASSSTVSTKTSTALPLSFTFGALSPAAGNKKSSASPLSFAFGASSPAVGKNTSSASPPSFTFGVSSPTAVKRTSSASPSSFTFGASSSAAVKKASSASPSSFTFGTSYSTAGKNTSSASFPSFTFGASSSVAGNKTSSASPLPFLFRAPSSAVNTKTSSAFPLPFSFGAPSSEVNTKTTSASPLSFTFGPPSSAAGNKTAKASLPLTFGVPVKTTSASHVFGQSTNFGQLTFFSQAREGSAFAESQKKESQNPFREAGQQLFAEPAEQAEGQDDHKLHFEPIIALPDEIQVVTGEEGLNVLFTERAKLYRFDVDSGQWKERGIGEIKLLRHPTSGRGRVLMRRDQIKKLCANHNITAGMELKPNVGSDRSWVWYTPADYAEGEVRPEKLAIKFKKPEIAEKFKRVFDDLKEAWPSEYPTETATTEEQKDIGCKLYEQFTSTFATGVWSCEVCYVDNKAEDSTCVACNSVKPGGDVPELSSKTCGQTTTNASVVELVEPTTFEDLEQEKAASFMFQSPGGTVPTTSQLFTFGRSEPSEDKDTADDEITVSPGTVPSTSHLFTIGRGEPSEDEETADDKITLSPSKTFYPSKQGISPSQNSSAPLSQSSLLTGFPFGTGTPSKFTFSLQVSPGSPPRKPKSPLSPSSPLSPGSATHGDDEEPQFEPLIPLSECRTGEEGQVVLFCERCKLFRYDSDTSQWKERGVGDIKILQNPNSGRFRVLMRRERVFKLCANHVISADIELKPFPNSDRAWLWTTLADFSEDATAAETLAARFRTNELASRFKEIFGKAFQTVNTKESKKDDSRSTEEGSWECDICMLRNSSDRLECAACASPGRHPHKTNKMTGQVRRNHDEEEHEADHDEPYLEPIISLPDKIDLKTGEEDDEVMFSHRAKLYRFVAEEKQWKERGVGDIKLLRNKQTGKIRVLMRRERVLKLCANHQVTTDMTLQPNAGSDRSWVWSTPADFSEEEHKPECLAVRFKNEGIAKKFKEKFEECQEILKNHLPLKPPVQDETAHGEGVKENLLAKFKAKDGSWKCDICMVRNSSDKLECVACRSPKPGVEVIQDKKMGGKPFSAFRSGATSSGTGFTFGSTAPSTGTGAHEEEVKENLLTKFKVEEGSWECDICMVRNSRDKLKCVACTSSKPGVEVSQDKKMGGKPFSAFRSGATSSGTGFTFGSTAPSTGTGVLFGSGSTPSRTGFLFGSAATSEGGAKPFFSFGSSSQTPNSSSGAAATFGSSNQTPTSSSGAAIAFGSLKHGENVTGKQADEDKKDVSGTDKKTPDEEVEQPGNEEGNASAITFEAQAGESNKETAPVRESETSTQNKQDMTDDGSSKEQKFLFGSSNISSLSFNPVAASASSMSNSPFGKKTTKSPGFAGAGSTLFASQDKKTGGKPLFTFGSEAMSSGTGFTFGSTVPSSGTGAHEQVKEDLLTNFKAKEESWECDICMVRNSSDKLECAACASPKPGAD